MVLSGKATEKGRSGMERPQGDLFIIGFRCVGLFLLGLLEVVTQLFEVFVNGVDDTAAHSDDSKRKHTTFKGVDVHTQEKADHSGNQGEKHGCKSAHKITSLCRNAICNSKRFLCSPLVIAAKAGNVKGA